MRKILFLSLLFAATMLSAQSPVELPLWPDGAPNTNGLTGEQEDLKGRGLRHLALPELRGGQCQWRSPQLVEHHPQHLPHHRHRVLRSQCGARLEHEIRRHRRPLQVDPHRARGAARRATHSHHSHLRGAARTDCRTIRSADTSPTPCCEFG